MSPVQTVSGYSHLLGVPTLLLILFFVGPAAAEIPRIADPSINELLEAIRKKHDLPALAGAIVNNKGLVSIGAVGVRKRGSNIPVTIDDQFHLGSDTKAMTAALVARLVEQGKLDWNLPIEKLLPKLASSMHSDLRKVTLVHLLSHHAGLAANLETAEQWAEIDKAGNLRAQRLAIAKLALSAKPTETPGKTFLYSNLGYIVAGAVIETAGDAAWEDIITKELFEPLAMKSTGFGPPGFRAKPLNSRSIKPLPAKIDQPWPHSSDGKPVEPTLQSDNPPAVGPAGRGHMPLSQWAIFAADQLNGARGEPGLLKPASYSRLHTPAFSDSAYTAGGWGYAKTDPKFELMHDGSNTMNYATCWILPQQNLAILVATNQGGDSANQACREARLALKQHAE